MEANLSFARYKTLIAFFFLLTISSWIAVRFTEIKSTVILFDNLHWTAGYATGAMLAWYAALKNAGHTPVIVWTAIGLGILTLGQIVWDVQVLYEWLPFPGPSDIFFIATGPIISIGLWQLANTYLDAHEKKTLALDTAMLLVGVLTASLLIFLPRQGGYSPLQLVVMAAYPLGLMLPACLAVNLLITLRSRMSWKVFVLPAALTVFAWQWIEWNLAFLDDKPADGEWLNIGFSVTAILIGASASWFSIEQIKDRKLHRCCENILLLLPLIMVGISAGAVVISNTLSGLPEDVSLVVSLGGAITLVLASIRQTYLLRERDRLLVAEEAFHLLANFDMLTGLPNRALLIDRLQQAQVASHCESRFDAVILINIDRFKKLNDARGHEVGDELLIAIGDRLSACLREFDTLARLTADEFVILLPNLGATREVAGRHALLVADAIMARLRASFKFSQEEIALTASLGITLFPESENDSSEEILRRADNALHQAKNAGGGKTMFFETSMGEKAEQIFRTERELHKAISGGELRLYLQSQVDARGQVMGAEALVRWQHPERGLLQPDEFIGIAEESDLIVELGAWVLKEACALLQAAKQSQHSLKISVNLSPRQFRNPGFAQWIKEILVDTGINPADLTLEVTEGLLIGDINDVISKMTQITCLGVNFSLDDFGTGYSSLAYLKRMPIEELKIDKTFIQDMLTDPDDAVLVETIISVAKHMRLKVVAEGVETKEQAAFLNNLALVTQQGYLFGRPIPADEWISHWRASILVR
jgi:diguanylate cyclase (GGDEF)-like protein